MGFEWDPQKNKANRLKHGISFADAVGVLEDGFAITIRDEESDPTEHRFVTVGMDSLARVLVVVYTYRGDNIRIISARLAERHERRQYEEQL